jgi:exosortase
VCCQWGWGFFQQFPFPSFLIAVGLFPRTTIMVETLWQTLTPPHLLENLMAWAGSWGLKAIGHPAVAEGRFIALSQGAVEVAYGCNGLYMAATMAIAGLVLGLFLKQSGWKIAIMMVIGALLAFVFNIPRIMLMTLAAVYWGKWWFDFWHGSWGGQIFVTILFTIYYYAVMAMVKQRSNKTISRSN